eukprot:TRINITY_DN17205_c0_g1_i1.p1 TRINITY_DN17205_c0_g1~~TRINITY_DN17205_c0_g1_i1.p1  ORF type:complete len:300 (+),score=86.36 TRINITY_DN17205_c0_g1_i1:56-955(+)
MDEAPQLVAKARALVAVRDLLDGDSEFAQLKRDVLGPALARMGADPDPAALMAHATTLQQLVACGFLSKEELAIHVAALMKLPPPVQATLAPPAAAPVASVQAPATAEAVAPAEASLSTCRKNFKCAVVVSPPESMWGPIQEIRQKWDKAYDRWMPHINLVWPFVHDELQQEAAAVLCDAVKHVDPFTITFAKFDKFEHSKSCVLFCNPETQPQNALQKLEQALVTALPHFNDLATADRGPFHPHLTVGQFSKNMVDAKANAFLATWKPITFTVDHVDLISRKDDTEPFTVRYSFFLGG